MAPLKYQKLPDSMLDRIRCKETLIFIGSDLGINSNLPDDNRLISMLAEESNYSGSSMNLPSVAEHYEMVKDAESLRHVVADKFNVNQPNTFYETLVEIPAVETIITTRYENALEIGCSSIRRPIQSLMSDEDMNEETLEYQMMVWYICGSVNQPSGLVLTREDFEQWRDQNSYLFEGLANLLTSRPLILLGYNYLSFREQFFKILYETSFQEYPSGQKPPVYYIVKKFTTFMNNWAGKDISKNHIQMSASQFMKLLPKALGGANYSTLRDARLPLGNVPDTSDFIGRQQELWLVANELILL
ncbi:MAG: SIR2 family protein [Desulfobacteraceae bacterium]|nr:SIR2 family protein [Desulfobacteraceae bacterium]